MIESLRSFAGSWVAKILLALLIASFAVFGVQVAGGGGYSVAQIGDEDISTSQFRRVFAQQMRQIDIRRAQAGVRERFTQAQAVQADVHRAVLRNLMQLSALGQEAASLGVDAPDAPVKAYIEGNQAFFDHSGFSGDVYQRELRELGYRRTEFEEEQRRLLAINLLRAPVPLGVAAPRESGLYLWRRENETRKVGYLTFTEAQIAEIADPGDDQLRAFYDIEQSLFTAPERRDVDILMIAPDELADPASVEESRIRNAYDGAGARFNQPERRNLERLDFPSQKEAQEAARRVRRGASLADLAAERARKQAAAGADGQGAAPTAAVEQEEVGLGYVSKEQLAAFTPALAEKVFADKAAGVLNPIEVNGQWAVVRIAGVRPGRFVPFEEARAALVQELALADAQSEVSQLANDVDDAIAAGATFAEIAQERRGVVNRTVNIDANGRLEDGTPATGLPQDPNFLEDVFSRVEGEEGDLAQTTDQGFWTAMTTKLQPATLRPFDEAREDVLAAWRASEKTQALDKRAAEAVKRIDAGEAPNAVAADLGVDYKTIDAVTRAGGGELPFPAVERAFSLGAEEAVGKALAIPDGDRRLVMTTLAVSAPDPEQATAALETKRQEAGAAMARDLLLLFDTAVENKYGGEIYTEALQGAALAPLYGGHGG